MSADVTKNALKSPVPIMLLTERGIRAPHKAGNQIALYRPMRSSPTHEGYSF